MFGNNPWLSADRWSCRRLFGRPLLLVAVLAMGCLLVNGPLAYELVRFFFDDDGDATLELPEELVLARLPCNLGWSADPAADGVLVALANEGNPAWQFDAIEHWMRPWKQGKREPIPVAWRLATQPDWQNDTAMVCHFGFNSPVTRNRRFLATVYHPAEQAPQTRIIALPAGQEIARLEAISPGCNGKGLTWHPTENVLVIAGYGTVTLAAAPEWKLRKLATAERDYAEWERRVRTGDEESGFYPNENPSQLLFSDDGQLLIAAMDRGVRVYDWQDVRQAADRLPVPRFAVDGVLQHRPLANFKMTFSVAYDARRHLVMWSENDGKLRFLNLATGEQGTLLALINRYCISRMHLCTTGDALIAEIVRISTSNRGEFALAVLDYPKLLQRAGLEPAAPADGR